MSLPPCGCKSGCEHLRHPQFPAQPYRAPEPASTATSAAEALELFTQTVAAGFTTLTEAIATAVTTVMPVLIELREWLDEAERSGLLARLAELADDTDGDDHERGQ
jgi:hypothetical protein